MRDQVNVNQAHLLREALKNFRLGIELLDNACAPAHIAAHVDLAVHQLQDLIDKEGRVLNQIDRKADLQ